MLHLIDFMHHIQSFPILLAGWPENIYQKDPDQKWQHHRCGCQTRISQTTVTKCFKPPQQSVFKQPGQFRHYVRELYF